jgi:hypothetical protein
MISLALKILEEARINAGRYSLMARSFGSDKLPSSNCPEPPPPHWTQLLHSTVAPTAAACDLGHNPDHVGFVVRLAGRRRARVHNRHVIAVGLIVG